MHLRKLPTLTLSTKTEHSAYSTHSVLLISGAVNFSFFLSRTVAPKRPPRYPKQQEIKKESSQMPSLEHYCSALLLMRGDCLEPSQAGSGLFLAKSWEDKKVRVWLSFWRSQAESTEPVCLGQKKWHWAHSYFMQLPTPPYYISEKQERGGYKFAPKIG